MEETTVISEPKPTLSEWSRKNPLELLASVMCAALTLIVLFQVLFRYALHFPLDWAEELAMVIFQWVSFVGAGLAVRHGLHFHLDLITRRFPERWQKATEIMASVAVLVVAYILIHVGIMMMDMVKFITLPVMHFSKAYVYLAIPVGGALMIVFQIPILVRQIRSIGGR
ncbi:MAG: TRAP transporter small permease [Desulfobacterales bacterium]|jgi:TRAP-type C4-dicarboxylate transport system permease small subunit